MFTHPSLQSLFTYVFMLEKHQVGPRRILSNLSKWKHLKICIPGSGNLVLPILDRTSLCGLMSNSIPEWGLALKSYQDLAKSKSLGTTLYTPIPQLQTSQGCQEGCEWQSHCHYTAQVTAMGSINWNWAPLVHLHKRVPSVCLCAAAISLSQNLTVKRDKETQ